MSQEHLILDHLRSGQPITAIEALERFNCFRLAARIDDLRREGFTVQTEIIKSNGKRFARYRLSPVKSTVSSPIPTQSAHASAAPELFQGLEVNGRTYY